MIPTIRIEPGTFRMGDTQNEGWPAEHPVHLVTITRPFLLGETVVTQEQWHTIMGSNPAADTSFSAPVTNISWFEAIAFCNVLSRREDLKECYAVAGSGVTMPDGLASSGYRLPTEAEWEYAARAGTDLLYSGTNDPDPIDWTRSTPNVGIQFVKQRKPNAWGLYDMSSNLGEWAWDWWGAYTVHPATDPLGVLLGSDRVFRGGGWSTNPRNARVTLRDKYNPTLRRPYLGFRVARTLEEG